LTSLVLVPGAWLGAWVWDRVTPILRSEGLKVYSITLPGLADRAEELTPDLGLMDHVDDLVKKCQDLEFRDAVIVGHSYAGAVVGAVARRLPDRFRAQVYLDTMPMDEGKSILEGFGPEGRKKFENSIVVRNGTRVWPMPEPLSSAAPTDGLTPDDLNLLRTRGTPQPVRTYEEKLSGRVKSGSSPKSHAISCVENESAAATEKEEFLKSHPDWTYHSLPLCHWPMLSSPRELASILTKI
jgi:pimeloyl-ACP methyl ester carboxylesterase